MAETLALTVDINAETSRLERALRDAEKVLVTSTAGMDRATKRSVEFVNRLNGAFDPAAAAARRLATESARLQPALAAGGKAADMAALALRRLNDQHDAAIARINGLNSATDTATAGASRFGGAAQQVGWQIGDFATQVAGGQNALVAFTQQGTQLLGMLGPWGAVIGAAGAVVGALAVNLFDAEDASKSLEEAQDALAGTIRATAGDAEELAKKYAGLSDEMRALESVSLQIAIRKQRDAISENLRETQAAMRSALQDAIPPGTSMVWQDVAEDIGKAQSALAAFTEFHKRSQNVSSNPEPMLAVAEAAATGAQAERMHREELERLEAALQAVQGVAGAAAKAFEDTGEGSKKAAKATKEHTDRLAEYLTALEDEVYLLGLDADQREVHSALLEAQNIAIDQGNLLTLDQIQHIKDLVAEKERLIKAEEQQEEATRKAKEAAKEAEQAWERYGNEIKKVAEDIAGDWAESIYNGLTGNGDDILSWFKSLFKRIAIEAIKAQVILPIATQVVGSMPGLFGVQRPAGAAPAGSSGGMSLGGLGDIGSLFTSGGGAISPGIDSWAQSTFGWGQIGLSSVGAAGVGSVGGGAAASLGVAAVPGGITNAAATAPGLLNGGSMTAGFGSLSNVLGIGGAILPGLISGNYAQAAAGGIGAAIGTAILPGIGTMVGGMLGNLVGSMFGGKDPHPAAGVDIVIGPDGTLTTGRVSSKHMGTEGVEAVAGGYIQTMNAVLEALGIEGGRNIGHGASIGFDQRANKWAVHNGGQPVAEYDSPEAAFNDLALRIIRGMDPETIGEDVGIAIRNSAATTLDGLADDIRFAQGRNTMFDKPAEAIGPFETALRELEAMFAAAKTRAEALGLSVEEMAADFEGAKRRVAEDFDEQIADQILGMTDPAALELKNLAATFEALRREAEAVGGSLDQVNRLYDMQRQRIEEQATLARIGPQIEAVNVARAALLSAYETERGELEAVVGTMDGLARSLRQTRLSLLIDPNLSPLSPEARMDEAARQFADISSRARLGDTTAMEQLPEISRQYLEVARGFYASSEDYARIFDAVSATLQDTETVAERHLRIAEQQLSALNTQATQLGLINTGIQSFADALAALGSLTGNVGRDWGANPALNQQIAAVLPNFRGDFGQGALSAYMQSASQAEKDKVNAILAGAGIQGRFADGGLAMPGLALVGERGPEVVDFRAPGRVYTNSELASALNRGGGDNGEMVRELKATNRILTAGLTAMREELAATRAEMADVRAKLGRAA